MAPIITLSYLTLFVVQNRECWKGRCTCEQNTNLLRWESEGLKHGIGKCLNWLSFELMEKRFFIARIVSYHKNVDVDL